MFIYYQSIHLYFAIFVITFNIRTQTQVYTCLFWFVCGWMYCIVRLYVCIIACVCLLYEASVQRVIFRYIHGDICWSLVAFTSDHHYHHETMGTSSLNTLPPHKIRALILSPSHSYLTAQNRRFSFKHDILSIAYDHVFTSLFVHVCICGVLY